MSPNAPSLAAAAPNTATPAAASFVPPAVNIAMLPDDPAVLKQMIAELLQTLHRKDRDLKETQQRLDALLRRLHGPRPSPDNPDQPLLFDNPAADIPVSPPPPPPPADEPASRRGKSNKPHGRRQPPANLRREPRRYELTEAERACPECGNARNEIGVETTEQYDYKPAEVFVVEHQQVKYACKCCEGQVCQAAKPPSRRSPSTRDCPAPDRRVYSDSYLSPPSDSYLSPPRPAVKPATVIFPQ